MILVLATTTVLVGAGCGGGGETDRGVALAWVDACRRGDMERALALMEPQYRSGHTPVDLERDLAGVLEIIGESGRLNLGETQPLNARSRLVTFVIPGGEEAPDRTVELVARRVGKAWYMAWPERFMLHTEADVHYFSGCRAEVVAGVWVEPRKVYVGRLGDAPVLDLYLRWTNTGGADYRLSFRPQALPTLTVSGLAAGQACDLRPLLAQGVHGLGGERWREAPWREDAGAGERGYDLVVPPAADIDYFPAYVVLRFSFPEAGDYAGQEITLSLAGEALTCRPACRR